MHRTDAMMRRMQTTADEPSETFSDRPMIFDRTGFAEEYPFESRLFDLDGLRYHYIDEGAGDPLLMVHGNPTWSFAWRNLIRDLRSDYRAIAVDHIGCGFSDKPRDYPYTLAQHVDNLCRFIVDRDLRDITLLGHDWGGCIGMGAAVRMPERFARFVLFNTAAFRSKRIPLRISLCRIPLLGTLGVRGLNLFSRAALRMAVADRSTMTPAVRARLPGPLQQLAEPDRGRPVRQRHSAEAVASQLRNAGRNRIGPGDLSRNADAVDLGRTRLVLHAGIPGGMPIPLSTGRNATTAERRPLRLRRCPGGDLRAGANVSRRVVGERRCWALMVLYYAWERPHPPVGRRPSSLSPANRH